MKEFRSRMMKERQRGAGPSGVRVIERKKWNLYSEGVEVLMD